MKFDDLKVLEVVRAIRAQYVLDWEGIHGVGHWARVWENGMRLAAETGADGEVVGYFALFHDACRFGEGTDPDHGRRGAALAASWRGRHFEMDETAFGLLYTACAQHTDGLTAGDITVQTCWDADRLDLARVGIWPNPSLLCTPVAKRKEILAWASERARAETNSGAIAEVWCT